MVDRQRPSGGHGREIQRNSDCKPYNISLAQTVLAQRTLTRREHRVVRRVDVDRLVERERHVAAVERRVRRRRSEVRERRLHEPRDEFLCVSHALRRRRRLPGPVAVPERQICIVRVTHQNFVPFRCVKQRQGRTVRVLESKPLLLGEEPAKRRVPERDGLVRAQLLHREHVRDIQLHALDVLLQALDRVLQVHLRPVRLRLGAELGDLVLRVRAVGPRRERVVEPGVLDHDELVVRRLVLLHAEEARSEVESTAVKRTGQSRAVGVGWTG